MEKRKTIQRTQAKAVSVAAPAAAFFSQSAFTEVDARHSLATLEEMMLLAMDECLEGLNTHLEVFLNGIV